MMLEDAGFLINVKKGFNWPPFGKFSSSMFIPFFEFIERVLGLGNFPSISPAVFFKATKGEINK